VSTEPGNEEGELETKLIKNLSKPSELDLSSLVPRRELCGEMAVEITVSGRRSAQQRVVDETKKN
jgi:hypothetical protein